MYNEKFTSEVGIQAWTKGFRVTMDSEEFQAVISPSNSDRMQIEYFISDETLSPLLNTIYSLTSAELESQRCMFFQENQICSLAFSTFLDSHGRKSPLIISGSTNIDWHTNSTHEVASRLSSLTTRLSHKFAETFEKNPSEIRNQLKSNRFLKSRFFSLENQPPDTSIRWEPLFYAITKWQGIRGVMTNKIYTSLCNVSIGTKFEAERQRLGFQFIDSSIDGYYDVKKKDIIPFNENIRLWFRNEVKELAVSKPGNEEENGKSYNLKEVVELLERIATSNDEIINLLNTIGLACLPPKKRK